VTVYSTSHQLVILARELRPRCSTVAGEERLTSPATIGLSAMYPPPPTDAACPSPPRQSDPGTDGPSIGTDADRRGIVPARLGKDHRDPFASAGARQVDVIGHQTIGPDWYAGAAGRRGGQPAIGAIVVGLEKHGLAPSHRAG